jgi:hypothetical protein
MRWKERKSKPCPEEGETRIRRVFLLIPCKLKGEVRWLEMVNIEEILWYFDEELFGVKYKSPHWIKQDFVD